MFYTLLLATFTIALVVSWLTSRLFEKAAKRILKRIIQDENFHLLADVPEVCSAGRRHLQRCAHPLTGALHH